MGKQSLSEVIEAGLELLPAKPNKMVFDDYKAKLYEAFPEQGRDAFAAMIKNDLLNKELSQTPDGKMVLSVSRL